MIGKWFLFWSGVFSGIIVCYFQMKTEITSGWAAFWSSLALAVIYIIITTIAEYYEQKAHRGV